jgi:hypothetical protein
LPGLIGWPVSHGMFIVTLTPSIDMKLYPHKTYEVKGMQMCFLTFQDDGTPLFYYTASSGIMKHIIYYWDKDLKREHIKPGPLITSY